MAGTPAPPAFGGAHPAPRASPGPALCRSARLSSLLKPRQSRSPAGLHFRVRGCHCREKKTEKCLLTHLCTDFHPTHSASPGVGEDRGAGQRGAQQHPCPAAEMLRPAQGRRPARGARGARSHGQAPYVPGEPGRGGCAGNRSLQIASATRPSSPLRRAARRLLQLIGVKFNLQQSAGGEAGAELARRDALASSQTPPPQLAGSGGRQPPSPAAARHPSPTAPRPGRAGTRRSSGKKPPRSSCLVTRATQRVSYGVAGCTHILIRKNNNLSKIYMICVFFPDRIYIGIIHQLAWHWPEEREKRRRITIKRSQRGKMPWH